MKHLTASAAQAQPGDWLFLYDRYLQVVLVQRLPRSKTLALTLRAGPSTVVRYYGPEETLALRRPTTTQDLGFSADALDKNQTSWYHNGSGGETHGTTRVGARGARGTAGRNGRPGGSAGE